MHVTAIIAAAGAGTRLGGGVAKQLLDLGGRSILQHSYDAFIAHPRVDEVIVVLPAELTAAPPLSRGHTGSIKVVAGGPRREGSVANAFRHGDARCDAVLGHVAARQRGGDA